VVTRENKKKPERKREENIKRKKACVVSVGGQGGAQDRGSGVYLIGGQANSKVPKLPCTELAR